MDYQIYHLLYDIKGLFYQEAAISTSSEERARELLREGLANFLETDVNTGNLLVRTVIPLEIKTDKEMIIIPRKMSPEEMSLARIASTKDIKS